MTVNWMDGQTLTLLWGIIKYFVYMHNYYLKKNNKINYGYYRLNLLK